MKQLNDNLKIRWGIITGLTIWAMVMVGSWSMSAPSLAWASDTSPVATPQIPNNRTLKQNFKETKLQLTHQQKRLKQARQRITKAQAFINKQAAQGKDISTIQAALNTFKTQLDVAQAAQKNAKQILAARAGFGPNGKVTDPGQAWQTIQNARKSLKEARNTLQQAVKDFQQAMQEFRQANGLPI